MGRLFFVATIVLLATGLLHLLLKRRGPRLGRLPGDLSWRGKRVSVFAPLATSLLLSVLLSLLLFLVNYLRR